MTTFDKREQSYENKFAHDMENEFAIHARRNKLIGLWASEKLGFSASEAETYATSLVDKTAIDNTGELVLETVYNGFIKSGIKVELDEIKSQMVKFLELARDQIINNINSDSK